MFALNAFAQNTISIQIKDAKNGEALIGATVTIVNLKKSTISDATGKAIFSNIPDGKYVLEYKYVGFITKTDSLTLPRTTNEDLIVQLEAAEDEELEEVVISTTRSSRTIANVPTRIEVIAGEELDEKGNMKPGDIRMILNESTGIQTQQTSATSANASIRIQGLDGRYTQILKDGFPLYSGAASGLGLLQTPPLDLKQVEVIKGSASTLYGGGAIAGLVNLISKTPKDERELSFHLNGTTAGGLDLNGYFAQKFDKVGLTVFASRSSNEPYSPGSGAFTAIPEFTRYTVNPKLYFYFNDKTTLNVGVNTSFEERTGGDIKFIKEEGDASNSFFERNNSDRLSTQFAFKHKLGEKSEFNIRNSVSYFSRRITIPGYVFDGKQYATFTEANYATGNDKTDWVLGANLWTDDFKESQKTSFSLRDYNQTTFGAFVQNNTHVNSWLDLETGLRGDYVVDYGFSLLPRISALIKFNEKFNSRIGGGLGYKAPTIFTEESERIQYQKVLPISSAVNKLERSYGANWDVNYRTALFNDNVSFSINHLLFYTYLNNPLTLQTESSGDLRFVNLPGHMDTKGMETNVKLTYDDFKLFVGYSFTDANIHSDGKSWQNPLTAKHRLNNVLMYEVEEKWKLGLEAYYYSKQKLNDGSTGKSYWITGFMAEKLWEKFSIYLNFENFTDTRQTRFDNIYTGSISNPVFRDIYAPLDGFVMNGGIKFRL
ncbi:TonB-dependent receptor plug domain-containing protein [Arcticibacter sp. MXS-1]|uniref:TonB-dependent receptor n=1 Tax=Arcticibacter sp. MXS-1 TaxID=3341726 RepID=UPI0035A8E2BA